MTRAFGCGMADGEERVFNAFFRAPSPIVSVSCACDKIAVGCQSGAVLTLHAAWLTDGEQGRGGFVSFVRCRLVAIILSLTD